MIPSPAPRYRCIADGLAQRMASGEWRRGDRLPSIRGLAEREGVSVSTAVEAYVRLEAEGWVEARPRSGFFVAAGPGARADEPGPTVVRSSLARRVAVAGQVQQRMDAAAATRTAPLAVAVPAPSLLPVGALDRCLRAAARSCPEHSGTYGDVAGDPELRRLLARRSDGTGPADVVVTSGGIEALNLAVAAVAGPGDAVAVESPTYFGVLQALEARGVRAVEVPVDPQAGIDLEALAHAARAERLRAVFVMPDGHNPLGTVMPLDRRLELAALARHTGMTIVEDQVFGDLVLDGRRPRSVAELDPLAAVITCRSFSKSLAPGLRIGWVASARFADRLKELKHATTGAAPVLPQLALARYLASGGYDRHLRGLRRRLAAQVGAVRAAVADSFPARTRISRPAAGFLLWIELPPGGDAVELCRRAAAHGIAVLPGVLFSPARRYRRHLRVSCGHPFTAELEAAVRTLGELARAVVDGRGPGADRLHPR